MRPLVKDSPVIEHGPAAAYKAGDHRGFGAEQKCLGAVSVSLLTIDGDLLLYGGSASSGVDVIVTGEPVEKWHDVLFAA